MLRVFQSGSWDGTINMLKLAMSQKYLSKLEEWGQRGVDALSQATPIDTGETASSWRYVVNRSFGSVSISWENDSMIGSAPLAVLLQYGHGTRNGGYVQGRDYINPAMRPIFDGIAEEAWVMLTGK